MLWLLAFSLLAGRVSLAQSGRGGISGIITNPSGAVVPKAKVTLLNAATGTKQEIVSSVGLVFLYFADAGQLPNHCKLAGL